MLLKIAIKPPFNRSGRRYDEARAVSVASSVPSLFGHTSISRYSASSRRRRTAFAASLAIHWTVAAVLLSVRVTYQPSLLEDPKYRVVVLPVPKQENRIEWYDLRQTLPNLAPKQRYGPGDVPQGQKDVLTLIVRATNPSSTQQLVWQLEQPALLKADVPSPNLIAVPAKTAPRQFVAPVVERPKQPPEPVKALEPAPTLNSSAPVDRFGPLTTSIKLPPRRFVAPKANSGLEHQAESVVPTAPPVSQLSNTSGDVQALIAGLNPADRFPALPPEGSRSANFARAPASGPPSSGANSDGASQLADLVSRGTPGRIPIPPEASAAMPKIVKETTFRSLPRTLSAPLRPSSRVIPTTVEAQFANRNVYTFVIPDVGLPEYSGDWVLWFAEDASAANQLARISAPVPVKKYAAQEVPLASAESGAVGAIQIAARIDRNGRVSEARVLRGAASYATKRRAEEELQTWVFAPTLRNGEAVAVDVVVELPFQPQYAQQAAH